MISGLISLKIVDDLLFQAHHHTDGIGLAQEGGRDGGLASLRSDVQQAAVVERADVIALQAPLGQGRVDLNRLFGLVIGIEAELVGIPWARATVPVALKPMVLMPLSSTTVTVAVPLLPSTVAVTVSSPGVAGAV